MPRHPPCALNNEHTNHPHQKAQMATQVNLTKILIKEKRNHTNTHKQTTKAIHLVCLMLASTIQFSHNTPTTPHQHTQCQQDSWSGTQKRGNNAPDTQQCTNIQTIYFYYCAQTPCVTKRHSNTWPCLKRCVFHPDNFHNNKVGSMTLAYSTNQGCNCTRIIKAP